MKWNNRKHVKHVFLWTTEHPSDTILLPHARFLVSLAYFSQEFKPRTSKLLSVKQNWELFNYGLSLLFLSILGEIACGKMFSDVLSFAYLADALIQCVWFVFGCLDVS